MSSRSGRRSPVSAARTHPARMPTVLRDLFGGAIKMELPPDIMDASNMRQIPDTQEVFLFPDSDASLIVEILQRVDPPDSIEAIRFHFAALAQDNAAVATAIEDINITQAKPPPSPPNSPPPVILTGMQRVHKYNRKVPDDVIILMALYRVDGKGIDIVLSANIPIKTADGRDMDQQEADTLRTIFSKAALSLKVVDFGLFA